MKYLTKFGQLRKILLSWEQRFKIRVELLQTMYCMQEMDFFTICF